MRTLRFYVLRQQTVAMIFVTLSLTCAIWLTQSLKFIKLIINRGVSLFSFLEFTVLLLPSFLLLILPIALFLAVLFTYNKLINDRELVVMRASGVSHLGLARPAIVLGLALSIIAYAISLYLMPVSFRSFKEMEFALRNDFSVLLLQEGAFTSVADDVTIYVRERNDDNELLGIMVHDNRDPEKPVTMMAERGVMVEKGGQPHVVMVKGDRQQLDRKTGNVTHLSFERWSFTVDWLSEKRDDRWREPNERFIGELFDPGDSAGERHYRNMFVAEGHNRLILPLYTLIFALIAVTGLLAGEFDKRGQTRRVLITVVFAVAVQSGAIGFANLATKVPAAIPLMYLNAALPVAACLLILMRTPRRRRRMLADPAASTG